jgi:hypothetical protein
MQTQYQPLALGQTPSLAAGQTQTLAVGRTLTLAAGQAKTQTLAVGQTRTLVDGAQAELHVLRGVLWLTQSGDPTDYFLRAGQSMALAGTRTVVQAEGGRPAAYLLQAPSALAGQPRTLLQPEAAHTGVFGGAQSPPS